MITIEVWTIYHLDTLFFPVAIDPVYPSEACSDHCQISKMEHFT